MGMYRDKKEKEKPRPRAVLLSLVYFIIILAAAYVLAGLAMDQVNFYSLLSLPRRTVPAWAIRVVLTLVIGFVLQAVVTVLMGLFSKEDDERYKPDQTMRW